MSKWIWVLAACGIAACGGAKEHVEEHVEAAIEHGQKGEPAPSANDGAKFSVAGMEFTAPKEWTQLTPTSSMRKASFEFGPVEGDSEKGELHVFYFGPGDGGDVDANVQRWLGQMTPATGAAELAPEHSMFTAAGYPVHVVKVDGTYSQSMGPATAHGEPKAGYRLAGAIVEGAQGNVFFKITGPASTVQAMEPGLETMLRGLSMGRE